MLDMRNQNWMELYGLLLLLPLSWNDTIEYWEWHSVVLPRPAKCLLYADLDAVPEKQRYKIGHSVLEVFHLVKVHLDKGIVVEMSSDEDIDDADDIEEVQ